VEQSLPGFALQKGHGSEIGATGSTNDGGSFSNIEFPQIVQQSVYKQWADLFYACTWVAASCNVFRRTFAPRLCHFQKTIFYLPSQCMQTLQRLRPVFSNGSWAGYHECSECGKKFYSDENDPERPRRDFHRHVQVEHSEEVSSFGLP
jgi:hypothetical protein